MWIVLLALLLPSNVYAENPPKVKDCKDQNAEEIKAPRVNQVIRSQALPLTCSTHEELIKKANEVVGKIDYLPTDYIVTGCGSRARIISEELIAENIPSGIYRAVGDMHPVPDIFFGDHFVAVVPSIDDSSTPMIFDLPFQQPAMTQKDWQEKLKVLGDLKFMLFPIEPHGPPTKENSIEQTQCTLENFKPLSARLMAYDCQILQENWIKQAEEKGLSEADKKDKIDKFKERIQSLARRLHEQKRLEDYDVSKGIDCTLHPPQFAGLDPKTSYKYTAEINRRPPNDEEAKSPEVFERVTLGAEIESHRSLLIETIDKHSRKVVHAMSGTIKIPLLYSNIDIKEAGTGLRFLFWSKSFSENEIVTGYGPDGTTFHRTP